jgi:hypothetical protein
MKRIHITGSPRSGTTLMLEMMATGFKLDVVGKKEISALADLPRPRPGAIACTKNPSEWVLISELLACDPERWFVFMVRDPRDVVVSVHRMRPDIYWTNLRLWNLSWDAIRNCRDHERLLLIRYEDLVRVPDEVQATIFARMPFLKQKLPFSQFHQHSKPSPQSRQAMHGVRPVSDSSIGVWRQHKARLAGQLELHGTVTDVLVDLGYERDGGWLDELEGVTPDISPGHWPDFVPDGQRQISLKSIEESLRQYKRNHGLTGGAV